MIQGTIRSIICITDVNLQNVIEWYRIETWNKKNDSGNAQRGFVW